MAVNLPPESYDPRALKGIEDAVAAARRIIANKNNATKSGQEPSPGLGDIALQAGATIAEQQQKDKEATIKALQAKIQTMAEQVFSGDNDSPEKDQAIANFSNQFRVEPKDDNPDEMIIYYYGQDGTRASGLNLDGRHITGELSIPSELQITELSCDHNQLTALPELPAGLTRLWCYYNQLTSLPELPAGLAVLECSNNQLTALPDIPAGLTDLSCGNNQLTSLPELPAGLTNLFCNGNPLSNAAKKYLASRGFSWR